MRLSFNPSVPELSRVNSNDLNQTIAELVLALTPTSGGFNYIEATKAVKTSYKGLHDLGPLTASRRMHDGSVGAVANFEAALLACPISFGRKTTIIDLSPRSFQYGAGRSASFRVPFLFIEDKRVKAYFLQSRKNTIYSIDQFSMFASIVKKYLLDTEFYGAPTDMEIVEVAERIKGQGRVVQRYGLGDLEIFDDSKIQRHLSTVQEALRIIEEEKLVTKKRRPLKDKDLPLFS